MNRPLELQLPLDDGGSGRLARERVEHLRRVNGVDGDALVRLLRSFASLRGIYTASDEQLARVVGAVAASRIRWFLDAPLDSRLAATTQTRPLDRDLRSAA